MRLYKNMDVDLTFQNCGSQWLMVLRGSEENISLVFNGLWNYGATNGELDFTDHAKTVAKFWSDEPKMFKYFKNRFEIGHDSPRATAESIARASIDELKAEQEKFINFNRKVVPDGFDIGTATAEKPDHDFRDKVLTHSFAPSHE